MEKEHRARLRRGALKELDDQLGELGQLDPAGAGTGALGLCGWENICKKFFPELLPKASMYIVHGGPGEG